MSSQDPQRPTDPKSKWVLGRRDFLLAGSSLGALTALSGAPLLQAAASAVPAGEEVSSPAQLPEASSPPDPSGRAHRLVLFPLDERCTLLSNVLWTSDRQGDPTLSRQHLWVQFPSRIVTTGAELVPAAVLGTVRFETSPDEGRTWRGLASATAPEDAAQRDAQSHSQSLARQSLRWTPVALDNLRVVVDGGPNPYFPFGDYFLALELLTASDLPQNPARPEFKTLASTSVFPAHQPIAGSDDLRIRELNGLCHQPPRTNRVAVTADGDMVSMQSALLNITFSRQFALVRSLGWDMGERNRQNDNLLSVNNAQGAFPVVGRYGHRMASDVAGGELTVSGRNVLYRRVRVVPELEQSMEFAVRENGFTLTLRSNCTRTFRTHEFAALRLPFDLYQCVTSILALPETTGPSGLIRLPLVVQAPNHGSMRVTLRKSQGKCSVYGRVMPFRVHAELWLDLIVGARPLENGLFELPVGHSEAVFDFELTKIFPFGDTDIFTHWERPPFYSFVDREPILGALPNEWLSGIPFRPEMGRFANNSVAEPIPLSAGYHGDMAAYTPDLAPGLKGSDLLRCAADAILRDLTVSAFAFTDFRVFPQTLASPIDLAWLTVAATGDWHWVASRRAELKEWGDRLLSREYEQTGLVFADASGNPGEGRGTMWLDSIRSGHLESYVTAFCARASLRLSELLDRIGEGSASAKMRAMHQRARSNYWKIFYDPSRRRIAIWLDRHGDRHDFDCFAHLGAAIVCGFVPADLARDLLREYLGRIEKSGFSQFQYGLPIVLEPIPAIYHQDWFGKGVEQDGSDAFGIYQNGSIVHFHLFYLLQALYQTGLRHEADDLFVKLIPRVRQGGPGISGPLHSGLDWRRPDGTAAGYEGLLAEQHHFMLAAITGYLGCELSIDGLRINPATQAVTSERLRTLKPNFARLAGPAS
jgi:hypothetical protein